MGQYYQYFNRDREEFVQLPGGMKDIERVTNPLPMGIVGYLLFEGPCDGGRFTGMAAERIDDDDPRIDEYIDREHAQNADRDRTSVYYDDDADEWDRAQIARSVGAGEAISDIFEYAGRWAGDAVSLTGDYADNDLYDKQYGRVVAQRPDGSMTSWEGGHPNYAEPGNRTLGGGRSTRIHRREAEPGETIENRGDGDAEFVEFVRYESGEWTDITDGVITEFIEFVGEEWVEDKWGGERLLED